MFRNTIHRGPIRTARAGLVALFACLVALGPATAKADSASTAFVPDALLQAAGANPDATFNVIVQARRGRSTAAAADDVSTEVTSDTSPRRGKGIRRRFVSISGVSAELTGREIVRLASRGGIGSITQDAPVRLADDGTSFTNNQLWPYTAGVASYWWAASAGWVKAPTIAIVDSGVDATRADFGSRVRQVTMTQRQPNSPGDGRGHGTFVASIAAGAGSGYAGASPNADIVSLDVMDDQGVALTSDVVAAADWIYQHKDEYGIRVANFSLEGTVPSSFQADPVDKAVEKLWLSGVVVVTAAGNYAVDGQPSGVRFSPANDPFVITVGATDEFGTWAAQDDVAAPWSAYGHTLDGFAKPELAAPGRYIIGAVPPTATLAAERPDRIVSPGYMELSGTSFAAPVVAGAAADLLAVHPMWTPDQVKGALMATAHDMPAAQAGSVGEGSINAVAAVHLTDPPNPNGALARFVVPDPQGGPTPIVDTAAWAQTAQADPAWASAYWGSAYWGSAYWGSAYWGSAYWGSAASADAYWGSSSVADNASGDNVAAAGYTVTPEERSAAEADVWSPAP
jgi:serine protease AprX